MEDVLGFRFGSEPLAEDLGEPGVTGGLLAVRLLLEAVDATESASEPRLGFDLLLAIQCTLLGFRCLCQEPEVQELADVEVCG